MLEILALAGVVALVVLMAWFFLRPKTTRQGGTSRTRKVDRPSEKRVSNVPANSDSKIEGIGKAVINSSDRRKKGR